MSFATFTEEKIAEFTANQTKQLEAYNKKLIKQIVENLYAYQSLFASKLSKKVLEEMCKGEYEAPDSDDEKPKAKKSPKAKKGKKEESEDDASEESEKDDDSEESEKDASEDEDADESEDAPAAKKSGKGKASPKGKKEKDTEELVEGSKFTQTNLDALKKKVEDCPDECISSASRRPIVRTDKNEKKFLWSKDGKWCVPKGQDELFNFLKKKLK